MRPFRGGAGGHRGNRAGRHGHDFQPGRDFVPVSFMSSISGRFLYQFGLTAAVAVLVSLLVSFTLTPMMSARLLRADTAEESNEQRRRARDSRSWFLRRDRPRLHTVVALGRWRTRWLVAGLALLIMASSVPLYKLVRQEYLPSNVDEGEFDVRVTAPEGTGLAPSTSVALRIEEELRSIPGVRLVLTTVGQRLPGRGQRRQFLRPACSARGTHFRLGTLAAMAALAGFQGQLHSNAKSSRRFAALRKHSRRARGDPQSADLRRRRRQLDIDFACSARTWICSTATPSDCARKRPNLGLAGRRHHAQPGQARTARPDRSRSRRQPGRRHSGHRRRAARSWWAAMNESPGSGTRP